jgi:hypothetical protein
VPFVLVRDHGYGDVIRVAVCDILSVHPDPHSRANLGLERYVVSYGALGAPDVKVMVIGPPTQVVASGNGVLYHAASTDPDTGASLPAGHRLSTFLMTPDLARECRSFAENPSAWFGYPQ